MLASAFIKPVSKSRSANASSVMRTSKAMLSPEFGGGLLKRNHPALFGVFDAPTNSSNRLRTFETVEHQLIAFSVLDDELGSAVHCQDKRRLFFLLPTDGLFGGA